MSNFNDWLIQKEACFGYVAASLGRDLDLDFVENLNEGRKKPEVLRNRKKNTSGGLFDDDDSDETEEEKSDRVKKSIYDPAAKAGDDMTCPITPLSGYEHHIKAIQAFAFSSPANFAQTLLFSPLSANVAFPKHWDNFQLLMLILKHKYPDKVSIEEIEHVVDSFGEYLHAMAQTIGGWKLSTISQVWSNKEELMHKLSSLAAEGDDTKLINELIKIPGVQPVKAGFIAQLLWGRAGCIDTHNIDIYTKAFPGMKKELNPKLWKGEKGVDHYVATLEKMKKRGIGTKELWDVWVDFVERFYKLISQHGLGSYTDMGTAIGDPDDKKFDALRNLDIPKMGATSGGKMVHVTPIGKLGRGASATHLQMDPDEALKQFDLMYNQGKAGNAAARSVPFRTYLHGTPLDKKVGLGVQPSLLKYFKPALCGGEVDPEMVRRIIQQRTTLGGKKAGKKRSHDASRYFYNPDDDKQVW